MELVLLLGPMVLGVIFWVWIYTHGMKRDAMGRHVKYNGVAVILGVLITLPILFAGGCFLAFSVYPPQF